MKRTLVSGPRSSLRHAANGGEKQATENEVLVSRPPFRGLHRTFGIGTLLAILLLVGCAETAAPPPIPPPMAEAVPKPPVSAVPLVWQPGHWDWTGSSYVWTPGEYVDATGHSGNWMPSYWEKTGSGWAWRAAHWM
jgi:WXXGXW repeat (2 copies)